MHRQSLSLASARLPLLTLLLAASANSQAYAGPAPSFIFLLAESLDGRLLRPDSPAKIPHIRALLAGGSVRFDSAYSNSPVCAPSRASLWSGRAPHRIPHVHNGLNVSGVWNNYEGLPVNYTGRLDQLLAAGGGYSTSIEGKTDWDMGGHSLTCMLRSSIRSAGGPSQPPGQRKAKGRPPLVFARVAFTWAVRMEGVRVGTVS